MALAIRHIGMHPAFLVRADALLWSINERLAGRYGADLPPLGPEWLDDLLVIAQATAEQEEQTERELHRLAQQWKG